MDTTPFTTVLCMLLVEQRLLTSSKKCGITFDSEGKPEFDEHFETKTKGLYLAGDIAVKSGGSIAIALNHAYEIVTHILNAK